MAVELDLWLLLQVLFPALFPSASVDSDGRADATSLRLSFRAAHCVITRF